MAEAATEGEASNPGVSDDPAGDRHPEGLGFAVDVFPKAPALCGGGVG